MDAEDDFHCQLGRTIQSWLWVESELYALYVLLMNGANSHLVSATFNNIQSVDVKLGLLNSCLALILPKSGSEWLRWKRLFNKADKLNKKRNKIVHEPVVISVSKGSRSIAIEPSSSNALALVKGQTTHKGAVEAPKTKGSDPFVSRSTGGQRNIRSRWHFRNQGHCKRAGLFAV